MGNKIEIKLIVLSFFFLITCIFVYGFNQPPEIKAKPPLSGYFSHIDGYESLGFVDMLPSHLKMLQLDDYVFANFKGHDRNINLYIGYYYSAGKAYRAHSPLVCYPAQGWKVDSKPMIATLATGPYTINYEEIVTSLGQEKELVLYWYQSHLLTNTQVYKNKIDMGYNKLVNNDEQHAFVRVAVPIGKSSYDEAKKSAVDFIHAFYPRFVEFIKADKEG